MQYKQWRCKVCADHTGEFSDTAVGDPWYRTITPGEVGQSLIVARTQLGLEIVRQAAAAGYLVLSRSEPNLLPRSQPNFLKERGTVWGRILACRIVGVAAPHYLRMPLFRHWWRELTWMERFRSIGGTIKRLWFTRQQDFRSSEHGDNRAGRHCS